MISADVFISYRSTEYEVADRLRAKLEARGLRPFLDTEGIRSGEFFARKILGAVRRARIVVVFFGHDLSSWVHFEAACAFFDEKLLPVALDGAKVPQPYNRISHESVATDAASETSDLALERIVEQVERRITDGGPSARTWRQLNRVFASGAPILAVGAATLWALGLGFGHKYVNHLHAILGAIVLGGQFFLSLSFARAVASPSFREREYGFETTENALYAWIVCAAIQPALGLWLVFFGSFTWEHVRSWPTLSIALYGAAIFFTIVGYLIARSGRTLDRRHALPQLIDQRYVTANLLFLVGFALTACVMVMMVEQELPQQELPQWLRYLRAE